MQTYVITANRNRQIEHLLSYEDQAETVKFDFDPWSDDNGAVSAVIWTVESGDAAISNTSLASNIAQSVITTSQIGASLIKIEATAGNNKYIAWLRVKAKDVQLPQEDYGLCHG